MRQRRLSLRRVFRVRDWSCGCGLIVRGFWSDAGRQVNDLSDTQLVYVGQLRVRFHDFVDSGLRSEITNGDFLDCITIPDSNLTSLLRGCGYFGLFLRPGASAAAAGAVGTMGISGAVTGPATSLLGAAGAAAPGASDARNSTGGVREESRLWVSRRIPDALRRPVARLS